jgi:hypothetical protein
MNFNYILSTGDSTISGSSYDILEANQLAFNQNDYSTIRYYMLEEDGKAKDNSFHFDLSLIGSGFASLVSLNSQTLLEGGHEINDGRINSYYTITDSGNYTIDIDNSENKFIFDSLVPIANDSIIYYEGRDYSIPFVQEKTEIAEDSWSDSLDDLLASVDSVDTTADIAELQDKYFLFFNGQKISDFILATDLDYASGVMFALPKKTQINDVYGPKADVYGSGFIDDQVDFYLNGMRQDPKDTLQLYTGVGMIQTGIESSVSIRTRSIDNFLVGEVLNLERNDQVSKDVTIEESEPIHGIEDEEDIFDEGDTINTSIIGAASRYFRSNRKTFLTVQDDGLLSIGDGSNDSELSMAFWIKIPQNGNFTIQKGGFRQEEYILSVYADYILFSIYDQSGFQSKIRAKTLVGITYNIWNHISITYNGTGSEDGIKIYVNGISYACNKSQEGSYSSSNNEGGELYIGSYYVDNFMLTKYSDCKIADLKFYDYELTSQNVTDLSDYRSDTDPTTGPILWLFRNEGDLEDYSGNELDATEGNSNYSTASSNDGPFVAFSIITDLYEWWENADSTGKHSSINIGAAESTVSAPNGLNAWHQTASGSTTYTPASLPVEPKTFAAIWRMDDGADLDSIFGEILTTEGGKTNFELDTIGSSSRETIILRHNGSFPLDKSFTELGVNLGEWNSMIYTVYDSGKIKMWINGQSILFSSYEESILSQNAGSFIKLGEDASFAVCAVSMREWSQTDVDSFHNNGNFVKYQDF